MPDAFIRRRAVISPDRKYRYLLQREWDWSLSVRRACFVMLNPSKADGEIDDPTIRSCVRLCRSWGYGQLDVVNLFAWRATHPLELAALEACAPGSGVGPHNDAAIRKAILSADKVICAWGAHNVAARRARQVCRLIEGAGADAYCLGTTKSGAPKHPLYIRTGTDPVAFNLNQGASADGH